MNLRLDSSTRYFRKRLLSLDTQVLLFTTINSNQVIVMSNDNQDVHSVFWISVLRAQFAGKEDVIFIVGLNYRRSALQHSSGNNCRLRQCYVIGTEARSIGYG